MKHNGTYNAHSMTIRSGAEFVKWLETIPAEYHESVKIHRASCIARINKTRAK